MLNAIYEYRLGSVFDQQTWFCGAFWGRCAGIDVDAERDQVINRLRVVHEKACESLVNNTWEIVTCNQIHSADIHVVRRKKELLLPVPSCDGLMTNIQQQWLGIYVADCAAVYLLDPVRRAIALLHSGKKGTDGNITGRAIQQMSEVYGSVAKNLRLVVSPCIRPPAYEVDFAAQIRQQALAAGVEAENYSDSGVCTYQHPEQFYSYRREQGRTGRMLAVLAIR